MKRQRLVSKGSLGRLFQQAAEAWKHQDYHDTIETLTRASRLDPANPRVFLDLGRAHGLRYDFGAAEQCLQKAVRIASHRTEVMVEAGRRCQEFGSYDMAKHYFEQAAKMKDASAVVFVTLAELNERHSRLEVAAEFVERALAT